MGGTKFWPKVLIIFTLEILSALQTYIIGIVKHEHNSVFKVNNYVVEAGEGASGSLVLKYKFH